MSDLSASACAAVLACLRVLAASDGLGRDATFIGAVSQRPELPPAQATACRKILARHTDLLPADLLAAAMDDAPDPAPAPRPRGRPRVGDEVLSPAERSRRRRAAGRLGVVEVPAELAARFRAVRDARGWTAAQVFEAALDALASCTFND